MKKIGIIALLSVFVIACLQEKGGVSPNTNGTTDTTGTGGSNTGTGGSTICDLVAGTGTSSNASGEICFNTQVLPILVSNCAMSGCHDTKSKREGYDLTSYASITKSGIKAGNASKSEIYKVMVDTGHDRMPPATLNPVSADKLKIIADWINQGAKNTVCQSGATGTLSDTVKISYAKHLKPILDYNCVGCHSTSSASGNVKLDTYTNVKTVVDNGRLYGSIAQLSGFSPMPTGGKLSDCQIKAFKLWIDQGKLNN